MCKLLRLAHPDYLFEPAGPLSWEQFLDWRDQYQRNPWGDLRQDLRNWVTIAYSLTPYSREIEPPQVLWPYHEPPETENPAEALSRIDAARARYCW